MMMGEHSSVPRPSRKLHSTNAHHNPTHSKSRRGATRRGVPERRIRRGSGFWPGFVREYWEKKLALLKGEPTGSLLTIQPDELFRPVVACAYDFCNGGRQKVRLYVDASEVDVIGGGHQTLLPKQEDGSFDGYNRRMVELHGFADYALVVADWHQFDRSLWERILVWLEGLTESVGISASRMDTQVFLGTYRATPFGVHADPTSAFHFPLIGTKTMRFWPDSFAAKTPELQRTLNYECFLEDSTVIEAKNGEVIYWPSDYWHVGESDGSFSVAWGLGYWMQDSMPKLAIARALKLAEEKESRRAAVVPESMTSAAETLAPVDDILAGLLHTLSSKELRQTVGQSWLEHYSAFGFLKVPPTLDTAPVTANISLRKKPAFRILASRITPRSICVAAAGHSCIVPFSPTILVTIDKLNQGSPVTLSKLSGSNSNHSGLTKMIDFCLRCGVLIAESSVE